ncbi:MULTISPECIES: hypothetical protein [unclassified Nitrospina]|uniref:hypothetical protein n=1 Tax=unclassified Nitrospina TaxID=2638683 RepID=UPI003F9673C9
MFYSLSSVLRNQSAIAPPTYISGQPQRKSLARPFDNGTFVLPLKQSFLKDARIMPGTVRMLALLAGWTGRGDKPVVETTKGILAKHLGRGVRQIYRYLQDAMEEGYLLYSCTKNRLGYITGIKIWINTLAIRKSTSSKPPKTRRKQDWTQKADTNKKLILNKGDDAVLWKRLEGLAQSAGFEMPPTAPV